MGDVTGAWRVSADRLREVLVPIALRVTLVRALWLFFLGAIAVVVASGGFERALTVCALALSALATLMLMPLRLRQRCSPLTDDDAEQLIQTASGSTSTTNRNRVLFDLLQAGVIAWAAWWLPPLAGAIAGVGLGMQLALVRWNRASVSANDIDGLNPLVRDLAMTRPALVTRAMKADSASRQTEGT